MSTHLKKKLEKISEVLERLAIQSAKGIPIIVEGPKDVKTLRSLAMSGEIIVAKTKRSFLALATDVEKLDVDEVILLLDFDGVIHSYKSGWKGPRRIPDPPVEGALEFIVLAVKEFQVMIYSSRSRQFGGKRAMKRWLYDRYMEIGEVGRCSWFLGPFKRLGKMNNPIPKWWANAILDDTTMEPWEHEVDYGVRKLLKKIKFPTKKPAAFLTIDDRAVCFDGNFPEPKELLKFKSWNKKEI